MFAKACVFLFSTIVICCESAYVDSLKPCSIQDGKCQGAMLQSALKAISEGGIPEINLSPIDPLKINNFTVSIPEILELKLSNGNLTGIRNSRVVYFSTNIDKRHTSIKLLLNVTVKSPYKVSSSVLEGLTKERFHGAGNGKLKLVNLKLDLDCFFTVVKKDNEIYLINSPDKLKYKYQVGKMKFSADKLYIGNKESSETLVALLNQNPDVLLANFGKYFFDKAVKIISRFINTFFGSIPARHYISEDLSAYLD